MEPTTTQESPDLAEVARRFRRGEATGEELSSLFGEATLYCLKGDEVGFMAVGEEGAGWIPMFTSELALARAEGVCAWFSAPSIQLLDLMPEGYGIVIDYGSDSEVSLPPWAIERLETNGPDGTAKEGA